MTVIRTMYILCLFIFLTSIIMLNYAKKNKKRNVCKYIIILSVIYIIFFILFIDFIPLPLNLNIGLEILIYRAILFFTIILFVISIIISNKKIKEITVVADTTKEKIIFLLLIIFPIFLFSFSYFRELYYINNSNLILVCSSGDEFTEVDFAYAISDNYCKEISIGTDFRGVEMMRYLPEKFKKLKYSWVTDKVEVNDNKIVVYREDNVIYQGVLNKDISNYDIEEIFYK